MPLFPDLENTLAPPSQDPSITLSDKLRAISSVLSGRNRQQKRTVTVFDSKLHHKLIYMGLDVLLLPDQVSRCSVQFSARGEANITPAEPKLIY